MWVHRNKRSRISFYNELLVYTKFTLTLGFGLTNVHEPDTRNGQIKNKKILMTPQSVIPCRIGTHNTNTVLRGVATTIRLSPFNPQDLAQDSRCRGADYWLERGLVDHVLEVCSSETGGPSRQHIAVHVGVSADPRQVQLQDLAPTAVVRRRDVHLTTTNTIITSCFSQCYYHQQSCNQLTRLTKGCILLNRGSNPLLFTDSSNHTCSC